MILTYLPRLVVIGLAAFFLVHLAAGAIVSLVALAASIREDICPRLAARRLLALRLAPALVAALVVVGVCLPSYLWLEPKAATERVGWLCLAAAALGLGTWAVPLTQSMRAAIGSSRFLRRCRSAGYDRQADAWIVDSPTPLLTVAGIFRPRLLISRPVLEALPAEELAAAVRHERAHRASHDNLKRFCILLAPGILPFPHSSRTIERKWRMFTEWAADDLAVAGSARHSCNLACDLAAALVRVASMGANAAPLPLATSLLGDPGMLEARVNRLLRGERPGTPTPARRPVLTTAASLTAAALLLAILQPAALHAAHLALERLVR